MMADGEAAAAAVHEVALPEVHADGPSSGGESSPGPQEVNADTEDRADLAETHETDPSENVAESAASGTDLGSADAPRDDSQAEPAEMPEAEGPIGLSDRAETEAPADPVNERPRDLTDVAESDRTEFAEADEANPDQPSTGPETPVVEEPEQPTKEPTAETPEADENSAPDEPAASEPVADEPAQPTVDESVHETAETDEANAMSEEHLVETAEETTEPETPVAEEPGQPATDVEPPDVQAGLPDASAAADAPDRDVAEIDRTEFAEAEADPSDVASEEHPELEPGTWWRLDNETGDWAITENPLDRPGRTTISIEGISAIRVNSPGVWPAEMATRATPDHPLLGGLDASSVQRTGGQGIPGPEGDHFMNTLNEDPPAFPDAAEHINRMQENITAAIHGQHAPPPVRAEFQGVHDPALAIGTILMAGAVVAKVSFDSYRRLSSEIREWKEGPAGQDQAGPR